MAIKMIWVTFFVVAIPFFCGCSNWKNYKSDNFVEEILEEVIEMKTGLDVDLSPFSPEHE